MCYSSNPKATFRVICFSVPYLPASPHSPRLIGTSRPNPIFSPCSTLRINQTTKHAIDSKRGFVPSNPIESTHSLSNPAQLDKLLISQVGFLAQRRLARGVRLNQVEATALIANNLQEMIRDGKHSVADLMIEGKSMLGRRHVLPAVCSALKEIQVEGTFPDGTYLVTIHAPISSEDGDLEKALYGSFLPIPEPGAFPFLDTSLYEDERQPGALVVATVEEQEQPKIMLCQGRNRTSLKVTNKGDRPVQVGSHYPFIEVNPLLEFDRVLAYGRRLDIPAGTAVRFEPGDSRKVTLVDIGGKRKITGGNSLATGEVPDVADAAAIEAMCARLQRDGFAHLPEPPLSPAEFAAAALNPPEPCCMDRAAYAAMFGPTTGDRVRLGDTELWVKVEKDLSSYGDECKFGGGKTLREGMGQATGRRDAETVDLVVTNALIVDYTGIYKVIIYFLLSFFATIINLMLLREEEGKKGWCGC